MADVRVTITTTTLTDAGYRYAGDTIYVSEGESADLIGDNAATIATEATEVSLPATFTFTPSAAGGTNICDVSIQAVDVNGDPLTGVFNYNLWLSDASSGLGHTASAASGTVTNKSACGLVVDIQVAKKAMQVQTLADGSFVLEITASGKTHYYVCVQNPANGRTIVGAQLQTSDYGS